MATSTKRAVARAKSAASKKESKVTKTKDTANITGLQKDPRYKTALDRYAGGLRNSEALLFFMGDIVKLWADSKSGYSDNEEYAKQIAADEKRIRMASRRDQRKKISERDRKGVAASEFRGVLKFARMAGATKTWDSIVTLAGNWTYAKRATVACRTYFTSHKAMPKGNTLERLVNKAAKGGSGGSTAETAASVYAERLDKAAKAMRKIWARKLGLEKECDEIAARVKAMQSKIAAHALAEKLAKPSKGKGKGKASNVIAMPMNKDGTIDLAAVRKLAKQQKAA